MNLTRRGFFKVVGLAGATTAILAPSAGAASPADLQNGYGCLVDTTLCVGCRKCEEACNARNHLPKPLESFDEVRVLERPRRMDETTYTVVNRYYPEQTPSPARKARPSFVKFQCMHCDDPSCVSACIVGALSKRPNGAVTYDAAKCIGCRYCMVACPFQVPAYEYQNALTPQVRKCNFCFEEIEKGAPPACARICPREAITFGKKPDLLRLADWKMKGNPGRYVDHVYGEREAGGTSWMYLASAPFENIGLPKLEPKAPPRLTESIQHGMLQYLAAPILLYGALGGIMWGTGFLKKAQRRPEIHQNASPVREKFFTPGVLLLLAIMAVALAFAAARFVFGIGKVSNLSNQIPWGIWIGIDVASGVALAAGGFTTGAIAYVFNRGQFHAVIRPALLTAMLGYTFVVLGLLVDIGRYWNITSPMFHYNGNSVLFEVAMCVMIYLTVLYIEFIPIVAERFKNRVRLPGPLAGLNRIVETVLSAADRVLGKIMFVFIILGIVLSCLHQSSLGTLMLIAPSKIHPLWYTPILPLLFLLSAFAAGYPIVAFESIIAAKSFGRRPEMAVLTPLAKYMPVLMGLYLAVKAGDMVVRGTYVYLFDGTFQTNAFVVELLFGVCLPFVLLLFRRVRESAGWLFFTSTLFILGVLLNRINVFVVSYTSPYLLERYFPALGEIFITAGMIAGLMFFYRVFVFIFPVLGADPKRMTRTAIVVMAAGASLLLYAPVQAAEAPSPVLLASSLAAVPTIADAPKLKILNSQVINQWSDLYEPVRFMHAKHANVVGDCSACHHRMPREAGDTYGEPVTMTRLREIGSAPVSCSACHSQPFNPKQPHTPGLKGAYHQLCMDCHRESEQVPYARGAARYSAKATVDRNLDARAPTDCLACHAKKVVDHRELVKLEGAVDGPSITRNCLACHPKEGQAILKTAHWNWEGPSPNTVGHEKRRDLGKRYSAVDNSGINLSGNWPRCTGCHIGYGWKDAGFDFKDAGRIDCLVCHDTTGTYNKSATGAGFPEKGVDLLKVAQQVGRPSRSTCGMNCHFEDDGKDAIRHGGMSPMLAAPGRDQDVHMAVGEKGLNFKCQDCHKTSEHKVSGRAVSTAAVEGELSCEQCHTDKPHIGTELVSSHLNRHTRHVACQTCHIPLYAQGKPTKVSWDWSTAGQDLPRGKDRGGMPTFSKQEGGFEWKESLKPVYAWYNGTVKRYLLGDRIREKGATELTKPVGSIDDTSARIYPFRITRGRQISDSVYKILIAPQLWEGFWKHGDWDKASEAGMRQAELPYSGKYEFVETVMYRGLAHEVTPKESALSCAQCHPALTKAPYCGRCHQEKEGVDFDRMTGLGNHVQNSAGKSDYIDFSSLGYKGDPVETGGRFGKLPFGKKESTRASTK